MVESTDLRVRPRGSEIPYGICDPDSLITISPNRGGRELGGDNAVLLPAHGVSSGALLLLLVCLAGLAADASVLFECWSSTVNRGRCVVRGGCGDFTRLENGSLVACPGVKFLRLLVPEAGELRSGIRGEPFLDVPRGIELACPAF